ncbi:unnamed protein product [Prorocentrum cordatum]|uniref:Uncharacterized protein n=1 Tax=Prorocentrum cordatum TaxID=2364126 RepID=A0ABN9PGG4_9DINO|nr:unnamed protein product [Polarella glacialis]
MFAGSGLDGAEPQEPKLSKRQQRLRQRQEELTHKFRELELLELYLSRFAAKRRISLQILVDLYQAMITATVRAKKNRGGEAGAQKNKKHKGRADAALRQLQDQLSQRISKLLTRALKQICRPAQVREVAEWCSPDEWADRARQLLELAAGPQAAAAGLRPQAVGSQLLYFFCASQRAAALGGAAAGAEAGAGWSLAEELLGGVLRDWGSKKDCEGWCEAALGAFAFRAPEVLLRLPWLEHVRSNKKVFAQRSQIAFISERLLRNLPPEVAVGAAATELGQGFTALCTELLEGTLSGKDSKDEASDSSASQRAKLRREGLRGLAVALKASQKKGGGSQSGPTLDTKHVASVVARVRDSLPAKRGQVYQLCWDVLRKVGKPHAGKGGGAQEGAAEGQKRPRSDGEQSAASGKKRKTS